MFADFTFQSTPPVKAATITQRFRKEAERISIHAAREGGDDYFNIVPPYGNISIHAAREGGDLLPKKDISQISISIHAAREGGDKQLLIK